LKCDVNKITKFFPETKNFFLVYQIKLGTIDQLDACDTEWQYRPFMNTTKKRQFLANEIE
jgi:hypothetical protein